MTDGPSPAVEAATRLAHALDAEDYDAARRILSDQCTYEINGEKHVGPDAILASYQSNGDWAAEALDDIRYESSVREETPESAVITYLDHLAHQGLTHTHQCEQRISVDAEGFVSAIEHRDLPGEKESLNQFFETAGLQR